MTCSGDQKVTTMILKVDLECCQCYKKIKRTLCRFPQIRDQVYDEKHNTVTITVVCCSPERVMDRLCSKAGKSLKSIHIKPPPPPPSKKPDAPNPNPKPAADPVNVKPPAAAAPQPNKPKPAPQAPAPEPEKPKPAPQPQPQTPAGDEMPPAMKKNGSKNGSKKSDPAPAPAPKPAEEAAKQTAADPPPPKVMEAAQLTEPAVQWVPGYPPGPPPQVLPVSVYYGGYGAPPHVPAYQQYGRPTCPPPNYYAPSRCDYFSEDDPSSCSIM